MREIEILKSKIRDIPNWPKKGILFKDITPVLEEGRLFSLAIDEMAALVKNEKFDKIVGIDARGFIFASALAYKLKKGLVIARKKGKLPYKTISKKYGLEYASDVLEMHQGSIKKGDKILICDDLLATGGTVGAVVEMIKKFKAEISAVLFFIELADLKGREKLKNCKIYSLIKF